MLKTFLSLITAELSFFEYISEEIIDMDNSTLSYTMTSTELIQEKELLEITSNILIDEVTAHVKEELADAQLKKLSDIIYEHTLPLYNVLDQLRNVERELTTPKRKIKVVDIFVPRNDSDERIYEIIESLY